MRLTKRVSIGVVLAVLLILTTIAPMVQAQDQMMTHTCDSTTIMLLFVAENDFGYHSMMDVTTFEKGQYKPLFDAMMSMMDEGMSNMSGTMDEGMMGDNMMMLAPPVIPDEDPACTQLRTDIENFLYSHYQMTMMMDNSQG